MTNEAKTAEEARKIIEEIIYYGPPPVDPGPYVDRILALTPAGNVVARELEWEQLRPGYWKAVSPLSALGFPSEWSIKLYVGETKYYLHGPGYFVGPTCYFDTPEAAKAAAQAHYNDAISKAVKPDPVPDGMVMVPEEITDEMVFAWCNEGTFAEGYRAMLRAALDSFNQRKTQ